MINHDNRINVNVYDCYRELATTICMDVIRDYVKAEAAEKKTHERYRLVRDNPDAKQSAIDDARLVWQHNLSRKRRAVQFLESDRWDLFSGGVDPNRAVRYYKQLQAAYKKCGGASKLKDDQRIKLIKDVVHEANVFFLGQGRP